MKERPSPRWGTALAALLSLTACVARAQSPPARAFVPYSDEPIKYLSDDVDDPVAKLQRRIDAGETSLGFDQKWGYLASTLKLLKIPVSSQTLVFSKTSLQYRKISPSTPRAIYFNDDVYVGWIPDADLLEISSFDPNQGAIFYQIEQKTMEEPALLRATIDCTQCHVARETRNIPGALLRSVIATPTGSQAPRSATFVTGHESPWEQRFGGWYITGTHGSRSHMGNHVFTRKGTDRESQAGVDEPVNLAEKVSLDRYLSPHSDIVAHLVLAHQTQMHNLITLVNFKTRIAVHADQKAGRPAELGLSDASRKQVEGHVEELLRYLLFADEAKLDGPVVGSSAFASEFASLGPRDSKGRSLRDFDLNRRLFRNPCSYLIYTKAFDALPDPAKQHLYKRLREVLTSENPDDGFGRLSLEDRRNILEILIETKSELPDDWRRPAPDGAASVPPPLLELPPDPFG